MGLVGGEYDPAFHPDKPSWFCFGYRAQFLLGGHDLQPSEQRGCWEVGRNRCGRGPHGS